MRPDRHCEACDVAFPWMLELEDMSEHEPCLGRCCPTCADRHRKAYLRRLPGGWWRAETRQRGETRIAVAWNVGGAWRELCRMFGVPYFVVGDEQTREALLADCARYGWDPLSEYGIENGGTGT